MKKYSEHCDIDVADFGDGGGFLGSGLGVTRRGDKRGILHEVKGL